MRTVFILFCLTSIVAAQEKGTPIVYCFKDGRKIVDVDGICDRIIIERENNVKLTPTQKAAKALEEKKRKEEREFKKQAKEKQRAEEKAIEEVKDFARKKYINELQTDLLRSGIEIEMRVSGKRLNINSFMCGNVFWQKLKDLNFFSTLKEMEMTKVVCCTYRYNGDCQGGWSFDL